MTTVLVLVTTADGAPDEVALQALSLAREMAGGGEVHALVLGDEAAAPALAGWGASQVHVARHPALAGVAPGAAPDAAARILGDLADVVGAGAVVGPGTEHGNTILARTAARAGLPFAANCVSVAAGPPVAVTRLRWGGSLLEEAVIQADRAILSVAPHTVAASTSPGGSIAVSTFEPALDEADLLVRVVERIPAPAGGVSLADANVVVSGGRGAGSAEGFAAIEQLAGLLNAAIGCSRAVTISGWRPHTDQVGQTGTKIAPSLYVACGISGATQHMAGCKGAKKILAINKDPEAPIMSVADYAVIGDLHQIVPAISAEIRRVRGG